MKVKLDSNELTITVDNTARTKAQKHFINRLAKNGDFNEAINYLKSFRAKRYSYTPVDRIKDYKEDPLLLKKNSIFNMQVKIYDLERNHTPILETGNWIGVEIECFIPYKSVGLIGEEEEYDCDNCCGTGNITYEDDDGEEQSDECSDCNGRGNHGGNDGERAGHKALRELFKRNKISFTSIKSDGSIDPEDNRYFPVEIVVLTRLDKPANLLKVCNLLTELKAKVNASCGMHIHLDARKLNRTEVLAIGRKFRKTLPIMARVVPKSRRGNSYCKLSVSKIKGNDRERYQAVNLTSFIKHKTIEVRLHSSTTDFNKIINWAKFISAIKNAKSIKKTCHSLNDLTDYVYLEQEVLEYFTQREILFNTSKAERDNVIAIGAQDLDSTESTEQEGAA